MTAAAHKALLIADGLRAVAEWEHEHGSFTEADLKFARLRVADERQLSARAD
jgi:hypothetical protein